MKRMKAPRKSLISFKFGFKIVFFTFILQLALGEISGTFAWNEEVSLKPVSTRRTVCVLKTIEKNKGDLLRIRSIPPEESCQVSEDRYRWMQAKDPPAAWLLAPVPGPHLRSGRFRSSNSSFPGDLWHFSCVSKSVQSVLGLEIPQSHFHAEMTSSVEKQDCETARARALKICIHEFRGNDLEESCLDYPSPSL